MEPPEANRSGRIFAPFVCECTFRVVIQESFGRVLIFLDVGQIQINWLVFFLSVNLSRQHERHAQKKAKRRDCFGSDCKLHRKTCLS